MNYKLVLKLKNAGFPLKKAENQNKPIDGHIVINHIQYKIPTLSELIEAFNSFAKLEHTGKGDNEWFAEAWNDSWDELSKGIGKTPEIAVAKLWLESNK